MKVQVINTKGKIEIIAGEDAVMDAYEKNREAFTTVSSEVVTIRPRVTKRVNPTMVEEKTSTSALVLQECRDTNRDEELSEELQLGYDKLERDLERYHYLLQLQRGVPRFTFSEWQALCHSPNLVTIDSHLIEYLPTRLSEYIPENPDLGIDEFMVKTLQRKFAQMSIPDLFVTIETLDHLRSNDVQFDQYLVNYGLVASEYETE